MQTEYREAIMDITKHSLEENVSVRPTITYTFNIFPLKDSTHKRLLSVTYILQRYI